LNAFEHVKRKKVTQKKAEKGKNELNTLKEREREGYVISKPGLCVCEKEVYIMRERERERESERETGRERKNAADVYFSLPHDLSFFREKNSAKIAALSFKRGNAFLYVSLSHTHTHLHALTHTFARVIKPNYHNHLR